MPRHILDMEQADAPPAKRVRRASKKLADSLASAPPKTRGGPAKAKREAKSEAESEPVFHNFRNLPEELQMIVWESVPCERRVIRALPFHVVVANKHTNAVNPLLHTCRLSRHMTIGRLILAPQLVRRTPEEEVNIPMYVDTLWDILDLTHIYRRHRDRTQKSARTLLPWEERAEDGKAEEEEAQDEKAKEQKAVEKLKRQLGLSLDSTTPCIQPLIENMTTVAVGMEKKWKQFKSMDEDEKRAVLENLTKVFPKAIRTFIFSDDDISWRWNYHRLLEGGKIRERLLAIMKAKEEKGKNLDEDEKTVVRVVDVDEMEDDRTYVRNFGEGNFFVETYNVHNRFKDK